jgi:hypothetical protein
MAESPTATPEADSQAPSVDVDQSPAPAATPEEPSENAAVEPNENTPPETPAEPPRDDPNKYKPCFLGGTFVALANGPRAIERVAVGDTVLAAAPGPVLRVGQHPVTRVHRGVTRTALDIEFGGATVRCTPGHLFLGWASDWRRADQLRVGDLVTEAGGTELRVTARRKVRFAEDTATYDLTVPGVATYFVAAGDRQVLVHNRDQGPDPFDRTLYWYFGKAPNLRVTDFDGLSVWKTTSRDDVNTLMDHRVNEVGRSPKDPHGYFSEADLEAAGIGHPQTPSTDKLAKKLDHHSLRPPGAAEIPPGLTDPEQVSREYGLNGSQMSELRTDLTSVPTERLLPKGLDCG